MQKDYAGRPSPLYHAKRLSEHYNKGKIYLKREDLNPPERTNQYVLDRRLWQKKWAKRKS
jgi:tryptophan synthase beta chain